MDLCNKVSFALTSSCDTLVNPDNTLTPQGMHVRDCIQGGALLAGAALLLGTPPTTIVSVLPTVAQLGGCGDAVFAEGPRSALSVDERSAAGTGAGFVGSAGSGERAIATCRKRKQP